jgi:GTP cyclohydrolase I
MMDTTTIKLCIATILSCLGEDTRREGLVKTPDRVSKMFTEIFSGYSESPKELFKAVFQSKMNEMVIVKDIQFYSHCEHHMVPFIGKVHIGYIPKTKVLGLSKFARLVDIYAKRLQIQENMTQQIANDIQRYLKPQGVMVIIEAQHLCMAMRGIKKQGSTTVTSVALGCFLKNDRTRSEFLNLIK